MTVDAITALKLYPEIVAIVQQYFDGAITSEEAMGKLVILLTRETK